MSDLKNSHNPEKRATIRFVGEKGDLGVRYHQPRDYGVHVHMMDPANNRVRKIIPWHMIAEVEKHTEVNEE